MIPDDWRSLLDNNDILNSHRTPSSVDHQRDRGNMFACDQCQYKAGTKGMLKIHINYYYY